MNFPSVPIVQWYLGVWAEGCNQKQWVPETGTDHSLVYGSGRQQPTVRCSIIAFVRMHSNLGIPVVQSHTFSRYHGRLPIGCPHWFYQGHLSREIGLHLTRFRLLKWRMWILNQWLLLVFIPTMKKCKVDELAAIY